MLFNSLSFLIFFPIVFVLYYLLSPAYRKALLLIASCYFYMSFVPKYIIILFFLITIDYFLALKIEKADGERRRRLYLICSIIANLSVLFLCKYFNFFNENIATLASFVHFNYTPILFSIVLPLGLSFHIFQSLSYVIEVYKRKYVAEHAYWTYALYVLFFPQLVAGPIERPQNLLPQLNTAQTFNWVGVRHGLEQMLWGFFKKVVIADQIAQIINPLYGNLPTDSLLLISIAFLFSYQLYCDFSGYSDIALGAAKMLGYDLQQNFNRPYAARSLSDFWRRWHISLSSWLRDYLYYPLALGWGKKTKAKLYMSLVVTFALIGLWHGANWTFVLFGLMHGLYLVFELAIEKVRRRVRVFFHADNEGVFSKVSQRVFLFSFVSTSFIFFRSETVSQALWFMRHMFSIPDFTFASHFLLKELTGHTGSVVFFVILISITVMELVQYLQAKKSTLYIFDGASRLARYSWYYVLVSSVLLFGYFGGESCVFF